MNETKKIEAAELGNGVKIAGKKLAGMKSVTVEVFFGVGAKMEKTGEHGMSHFLEHMVFKGTKKRKGALAVAREIDSKGANYNAQTGLETTSFFITTTGENFGWAVEILADLVFRPEIPREEVIKERGVIVEEIKMYRDNPMMGLAGEFAELMWQNSSRGCFDVAGKVEEIESVDRDRVVEFRKNYWERSKMAVVTAGNLPDDWKDTFNMAFGSEERQKEQAVKLDLDWSGPGRRILRRKNEQGHFCLGWPTAGRKDDRRYAWKLLELILCGSSSSRLHKILREDRGWAYYVFGMGEVISEGGFLGIQSGVRKDKVEEAIELVCEEVGRLGQGLDEGELGRARAYLKGKLVLAMDRSSFWTDFIGERLVLGEELMRPQEEIRNYLAVEEKEIKNLAVGLNRKDMRLLVRR